MIKYIIKRLLQLIPILVGITFLSFAMMRLAGGDAVTYMYENAGTSALETLLSSESLAEFLNRAENAIQISTYDRNMLVRQFLRK